MGLAVVLQQAGFTVDAITLTQMCIQVDPTLALHHFFMGTILAGLRDHDISAAAFFFGTALRLQPDFLPAITRLCALRCMSRPAPAAGSATESAGAPLEDGERVIDADGDGVK